jgi:transmembrane sensor
LGGKRFQSCLYFMNLFKTPLQEHDWEMIVRYLDGLSTPEEKASLQERMRTDSAFSDEFSRAQALWNTSKYRPLGASVLANDTRKDWQKVNDALRGGPNWSARSVRTTTYMPFGMHRRYVQALRLAAILLVTIVSSVFITYTALSPVDVPVPEIVFREIQTDRNQRVNLLLSDGTGVSLSVESRLRIPEKFASDKREVELEGEARFDVAHAASRPFIIRSGEVTVEVLGTDFGVRAYENEDRIDVVVKSGSVAVARTGTGDPERLVLSPGQLVTVRRSGEPMHTRWVNPDDYLSWMSGRMKFYETPFHEVIRQLERWYDIEVEVNNIAIHDFSLTALLDMRSMQNVFEVISQSLKLHYDIEGQVVILSLQEDAP